MLVLLLLLLPGVVVVVLGSWVQRPYPSPVPPHEAVLCRLLPFFVFRVRPVVESHSVGMFTSVHFLLNLGVDLSQKNQLCTVGSIVGLLLLYCYGTLGIAGLRLFIGST